MTLPTKTPAWIFQNLVSGDVDFSDSPSATFRLGEVSLPSELSPTALLVQNLYIGNDPGLRLYISAGHFTAKASESLPDLPPGSVMRAFTVSKVLKIGGAATPDGDDQFKEGDLVFAMTGWAQYSVVEKNQATVVQALPGLSPSIYLGTLGLSGQSAFWCLTDVLKPKQTDTLVVSGAAGAVGNVVVQYAKNVLNVKHVVGIAGSQEKCEWLEKIGADAALNYKSKTFAEDLKNAVPNGVDKFFDNAGGHILDEVLLHMNPHGVVGVCGAMAVQEDNFSTTLNNYGMIILNSLELKGFRMSDYMDRIEEGGKALAASVLSRKFVVGNAETVIDLRGRFEEIPKTWYGLFEGKNTGKLIIKLAN